MGPSAICEIRFRIPIEHREKLRAAAKANDRSIAQEGRHALRLYLAMLEGRLPVGIETPELEGPPYSDGIGDD
jgi:hypothetical protein